jgi:hypothetical protein
MLGQWVCNDQEEQEVLEASIAMLTGVTHES